MSETERPSAAAVPAQRSGGGITLVQPASLLPSDNEAATMYKMAEAFHASGLMPGGIRSPAAAFLVIQKGRELGLPPSYACSNIHIIEGKPSCSAELLLALIKSRVGPDALIVEETDGKHCTVSYARPHWDKRRTFTFTIEQAQQAGLLDKGGDRAKLSNWNRFPDAMLRARCISALARMEFADVIGGMYTPDELGAAVNLDPATGEMISVQVTSEPVRESAPKPAPQPEPKRVPDPATVPVTKRTRNAIMQVAIDKGVMPSALDAKVKELTGCALLDDCTEAQAHEVAAWLKTVTPAHREPEETTEEPATDLYGAVHNAGENAKGKNAQTA